MPSVSSSPKNSPSMNKITQSTRRHSFAGATEELGHYTNLTKCHGRNDVVDVQAEMEEERERQERQELSLRLQQIVLNLAQPGGGGRTTEGVTKSNNESRRGSNYSTLGSSVSTNTTNSSGTSSNLRRHVNKNGSSSSSSLQHPSQTTTVHSLSHVKPFHHHRPADLTLGNHFNTFPSRPPVQESIPPRMYTTSQHPLLIHQQHQQTYHPPSQPDYYAPLSQQQPPQQLFYYPQQVHPSASTAPPYFSPAGNSDHTDSTSFSPHSPYAATFPSSNMYRHPVGEMSPHLMNHGEFYPYGVGAFDYHQKPATIEYTSYPPAESRQQQQYEYEMASYGYPPQVQQMNHFVPVNEEIMSKPMMKQESIGAIIHLLDSGAVLRRTGVCKFFDLQKGFGFILDDNIEELNGRDVFIHYTAIRQSAGFRCLATNEAVEYDIVKASSGGYQALNLSGRQGKALQGFQHPSLSLDDLIGTVPIQVAPAEMMADDAYPVTRPDAPGHFIPLVKPMSSPASTVRSTSSNHRKVSKHNDVASEFRTRMLADAHHPSANGINPPLVAHSAPPSKSSRIGRGYNRASTNGTVLPNGKISYAVQIVPVPMVPFDTITHMTRRGGKRIKSARKEVV